MKFSERWLREWVSPPLSTRELCDKLTMSGLEVDGVEPAAPDFDGVVVGEVLAVAPHPDADKLRVCQVNAGGETLQIVCGAPNVHQGMRAPLARVGARLPGDFKIRAAKLRGVESRGMLCSARELGLSEDAAGLMPLPGDAPAGQDVREYLQLDDSCIEVDFTPNRGDCLSIRGLAREVGALTGSPVKPLEQTEIAPVISQTFPVSILNPLACPRYTGRVVRNVNTAAPTPIWMLEKLRRCGLRGINIVVDITNYLLLELGQPMHAFDLHRLKAGIEVRDAREGETLILLDDREITLGPDTLVIADQNGPLALAGVMGGAASGVTGQTRDIFFESAFFTPLPLAGCARRHGLQTDSSYRFERGVDFRLQRQALEYATALLLKLAGGEPGPVIDVEHGAHLPQSSLIPLRASRIRRLLGTEVPMDRVTDSLVRLGMQVKPDSEENWLVTPPSYRFDITQEVDLIEEVARLHGYDNIPSLPPRAEIGVDTAVARDQRRLPALRGLLVQRGYHEAITYSFVNPEIQTKLMPLDQDATLTLANPLANDMSVMRTTLWSGLLPTLAYNQKRQQPRVRLFETGQRFIREPDGGIRQQAMLAGVVAGPLLSEQWGEPRREVDFFDLKADVEALLALTGQAGHRFEPREHPALHPGQSAVILAPTPQGEPREIGWLGALHPALVRDLEVEGTAYLFELELDYLLQWALPGFQAISRYPSVRRDLALVVEQAIPAGRVLEVIRQQAGELLNQLRLFDIYQGKGIDPDKKSLAVGLTFRAVSRNLTEDEIDSIIARVLKGLEQAVGASLRD